MGGYGAIRIGIKHPEIFSGLLDKILNDYAIGHMYETYDGNHINRIAERLEKKVLPFFAVNLK
jgi:hypothetical protein